jgi:ribosomal protein S13
LLAGDDFQHILRVLNTNVDGKNKVMYAITSIRGIGRRFANLVCKKAEVDMRKRWGLGSHDVSQQLRSRSAIRAAKPGCTVSPTAPTALVASGVHACTSHHLASRVAQVLNNAGCLGRVELLRLDTAGSTTDRCAQHASQQASKPPLYGCGLADMGAGKS